MVLPVEYWSTLVLQQVGPQLRVETDLYRDHGGDSDGDAGREPAGNTERCVLQGGTDHPGKLPQKH
ncbi:hypothetical protein GCM10018771_05130 [Streptomyces cellulosae]|nr:hypothetical protein GCM10018771_05130 [Streptomyces cellulosae]